MRVIFEVAGDRQIAREILRVGHRAGDASPAFRRLARLFRDETREQFLSEGRHASGGWRPLKATTLQAKRRRGQDLRILRATDDLFYSLVTRDPNHLEEIRPDELRWGSKLPYAAAHQNPGPGSRLPRRRPIEFTEHARRQAVKIVQRFIVTGEVEL